MQMLLLAFTASLVLQHWLVAANSVFLSCNEAPSSTYMLLSSYSGGSCTGTPTLEYEYLRACATSGTGSYKYTCTNSQMVAVFYSDTQCSHCTSAVASDFELLGVCQVTVFNGFAYSSLYTCIGGGGTIGGGGQDDVPTEVATEAPTTALPTVTPSFAPTNIIDTCTAWIQSNQDCPVGYHLYGENRLKNTACTLLDCNKKCCYKDHTLTVTRKECNKYGIFGELTLDGVATGLKTLEPINPCWTMKLGTFKGTYRRMNNLKVNSPYIKNIKNCTNHPAYIHFHHGVFLENTQGCVLVGLGTLKNKGITSQLTSSQLALRKLNNLLNFTIMRSPNTFTSDPFAKYDKTFYDSSNIFYEYPVDPLTYIFQNDPSYVDCQATLRNRRLSEDFPFVDFSMKYIVQSNYFSVNEKLNDSVVAEQLTSRINGDTDLLQVIPYFYQESDDSIEIDTQFIFNITTTNDTLLEALSDVTDISSLQLTNDNTQSASILESSQTCSQCPEGYYCEISTLSCVEDTSSIESNSKKKKPVLTVVGIIVIVAIVVVFLLIVAVVVFCCTGKSDKVAVIAN